MNTNHYQNFVTEYQDIVMKQFECNGITMAFPAEIEDLTEQDLTPVLCRRKDFRGEDAFTIDCTDCKDMDDAVSVIKTSYGYRLAVHIADVSAYVVPGSDLSALAENRATSVYLPNITVPMLPKVLSNNLCSLNPNEDRNTLSIILKINNKGKVISYEITKGLIHSRLKGDYSEINAIFDGTAPNDVYMKYQKVYKQLQHMRSLYKILRKNRIANGARIEDDNKPYISVKEKEILITPRKDGVAENMIEEFMVLANMTVAEFMIHENLPSIFRVQEKHNTLASYQTTNNGHPDVAADSYTHFTSPIRRVADLKVHQILSAYLEGVAANAIHRSFDDSLEEICERATKRSRTVNQVELYCRKYCYKKYFSSNRQRKYVGKIKDYDENHRPIYNITKLNINVLGIRIFRGNIGDRFKLSIMVDEKSNLFYVQNVMAI